MPDLIKNTSDLYEQDVKFIVDHLNNDPLSFWSRSLIRTCVTLFESETYLLKQELLEYCNKESIKLSPEITLALTAKKIEIKDNGTLKLQYLQTPLTVDIKFLYRQMTEIHGFSIKRDFDDSGWGCLQNTIKVRNRLTHPKSFDDQAINDREIEECICSYEWFYDNTINFLEQRTSKLQAMISELSPKDTPRNPLAGNNTSPSNRSLILGMTSQPIKE